MHSEDIDGRDISGSTNAMVPPDVDERLENRSQVPHSILGITVKYDRQCKIRSCVKHCIEQSSLHSVVLLWSASAFKIKSENFSLGACDWVYRKLYKYVSKSFAFPEINGLVSSGERTNI